MWYFSWILGVGLAASFAILNAMWLEVQACQDENAALNADAKSAQQQS